MNNASPLVETSGFLFLVCFGRCFWQDKHHVLHMLDFFYFEEHLVIVSELLGKNLYEFSNDVLESGKPPYFTVPRLCKIVRQCLEVRW